MSRIRVLVRSKPDRMNLLLYYIDPLTGREFSRSADTADRREAERAAARWEAELAAGTAPGSMSWDMFRTRFEDEHAAHLSKKSQKSYGTAFNKFEKLVGHPRDMSAITASVVSRFQASLRAQQLSEQSIATHLTHLRSALRWAASIGILQAAPAFRLPRPGRRRFARGRPLTDAEFQRILQAVPKVVGQANSPEWQRLLRGLWLAGLRLGEAMRLSWDSPPVRVVLDGGRFPLILWHAEGHKARRDEATPLTPDFAAFLRETPEAERHGPVFRPRLKSRQVSAKTAGITISTIGETAGVVVNDSGKHATAHDLRRSFGNRWALKCRPVTLKALMRHSSLETTLGYYVDLSCDDVGAELWGLQVGGPIAGPTGEPETGGTPVPVNVPAEDSGATGENRQPTENAG